MKYSELIFSNKNEIKRKAKIGKMENKLSNPMASTALELEKKNYVKNVVGVPEFDQSVSHLSQYTMERGSVRDQIMLNLIVNKMKSGDLGYDDLGQLNDVCGNNFKYFFSSEPEKRMFNSTVVVGVVLTIFAIILRVNYESVDSLALMVFLVLINLVAIVYTLCCWPTQVVDTVEVWLSSNNIPSAVGSKITSRVMKTMAIVVGIVLVLVVIWLAISHWVLNNLALGNDVVAIISLGTAALSDGITNWFAKEFEWGIYHNK